MHRRKGELQNEKQLYKRMFNKDASKSEDSSSSSSSRKNEDTSSKAKFLTLGLLLSGTAIAVAGMMAYRYNHRFVWFVIRQKITRKVPHPLESARYPILSNQIILFHLVFVAYCVMLKYLIYHKVFINFISYIHQFVSYCPILCNY